MPCFRCGDSFTVDLAWRQRRQWVVWCVVGAATISTLSYFCAFEALKYDALAWTFVPLGYYFISGSEFVPFAIVFFVVTCLSVSVTIVQGFLWFLLAVAVGPVQLAMLAFVPGGIKLATHFAFVFAGGVEEVRTTSSAIGLNKAGATRRKLHLGPTAKYHAMLTILPVLLLLINGGVRRFADGQSIYALAMFSFSCVVLMEADWRLMPFLWIAISPSPRFLDFFDRPKKPENWWIVPRLKPYSRLPVDTAIAFGKAAGNGIDLDTRTCPCCRPLWGGPACRRFSSGRIFDRPFKPIVRVFVGHMRGLV